MGSSSVTSITGILVRAAMMRESSLPCSGSRCTITTKAAPTLAGKASKNACSAATPPADAPILATGTRTYSEVAIGLLRVEVGASLPRYHKPSWRQLQPVAHDPMTILRDQCRRLGCGQDGLGIGPPACCCSAQAYAADF